MSGQKLAPGAGPAGEEAVGSSPAICRSLWRAPREAPAAAASGGPPAAG